jgi:hypothetical protein
VERYDDEQGALWLGLETGTILEAGVFGSGPDRMAALTDALGKVAPPWEIDARQATTQYPLYRNATNREPRITGYECEVVVSARSEVVARFGEDAWRHAVRKD